METEYIDARLILSLRPTGLTGNADAIFRESFLARSARARKPGRHHRTWMKRLPDSWWLGEAIGDDPQSWRVEAKANMGSIDLDVLPLAALLLQARAPGDHPVGARVDRRRRDPNRLGQPAHPFGSRRLIFAL